MEGRVLCSSRLTMVVPVSVCLCVWCVCALVCALVCMCVCVLVSVSAAFASMRNREVVHGVLSLLVIVQELSGLCT